MSVLVCGGGDGVRMPREHVREGHALDLSGSATKCHETVAFRALEVLLVRFAVRLRDSVSINQHAGVSALVLVHLGPLNALFSHHSPSISSLAALNPSIQSMASSLPISCGLSSSTFPRWYACHPSR